MTGIQTNLNQSGGLQGGLPQYQPMSEIVEGGATGLTKQQQNVIEIIPTRSMTKRKLYAWIWAAYSGANSHAYFVVGTITFWNNNSKVGTLPLATGDISGGGIPDIVTVATVAGNNVQDSIGLFVGSPATVNGQAQPFTVLLQPLYISGEVDRITLSIDRLLNVAGCRAFLACISSQA